MKLVRHNIVFLKGALPPPHVRTKTWWKLKSASCGHRQSGVRSLDENIKHKRTFWFKSCLNTNGRVWGCESCCRDSEASTEAQKGHERTRPRGRLCLQSTAWRQHARMGGAVVGL